MLQYLSNRFRDDRRVRKTSIQRRIKLEADSGHIRTIRESELLFNCGHDRFSGWNVLIKIEREMICVIDFHVGFRRKLKVVSGIEDVSAGLGGER